MPRQSAFRAHHCLLPAPAKVQPSGSPPKKKIMRVVKLSLSLSLPSSLPTKLQPLDGNADLGNFRQMIENGWRNVLAVFGEKPHNVAVRWKA